VLCSLGEQDAQKFPPVILRRHHGLSDRQKIVPVDLEDQMSFSAADFLDQNQYAALAGKHKITIRRWHHAGKGPQPIRISRSVLYVRAEVVEWLRQQEKHAKRKGARKTIEPPMRAARKGNRNAL
jgi:predicted DNA-binding transcriptional regulator AlpA